MIAVIKGDIIGSRRAKSQAKWIIPLKELFNKWGKSPRQWEIVWGDFFQIEFQKPHEVLLKVFAIKALMKYIGLDVRMAIGIGKKSYSGKKISQSNGTAFVYAGEKFDILKKTGTNLAFKCGIDNFDADINLSLKLACNIMDDWTTRSAELFLLVLKHPKATQQQLGKKLKIQQSTISDRWHRAKVSLLLEVEKHFREKIKINGLC